MAAHEFEQPPTGPEGAEMPLSSSRPAAPLVTPASGGELSTITSSRPSAHGAASISPGSQLGPYRLLEKLGEGGMGAVFRARHEHLNNLVAIKLLSSRVMARPDAVARFQREMKAVGRVNHPSVVRATNAGQIDGVHFLAMELLEGTDVHRRVLDTGPLPVAEACSVIREAALALAAAHAVGLVHRDVKPSNLWLCSDGRVKLLDLGLALLAGDAAADDGLTGPNEAFGTPDFMAPEQWGGVHFVDHRADLYSLGCTLYFLLTGKAPFTGPHHSSNAGKMRAHILEPPPDLETGRTDVPDALAGIYARLMAKRPDDRYQTADELAAALVPFAAGGGDDAPAEPSPRLAAETFTRSMLRRRPILVAVAAGAAIVIVGLCWAIFGGDRTGNKTSLPAPGVPPNSGASELRVLKIEVTLFAKHRVHKSGAILGKQSFLATLGDQVQVRALLSRPAYAFLIALRPDGVADLCYPANETEPPPFALEPRYPPDDAQVAYGLREGAGMWAFAVVASDEPLPSWSEWLERRGRGPAWKPVPTEDEVVWWDDGQSGVRRLAPGELLGTPRGKGEALESPMATIAELTRSLRSDGSAASLGFSVIPGPSDGVEDAFERAREASPDESLPMSFGDD